MLCAFLLLLIFPILRDFTAFKLSNTGAESLQLGLLWIKVSITALASSGWLLATFIAKRLEICARCVRKRSRPRSHPASPILLPFILPSLSLQLTPLYDFISIISLWRYVFALLRQLIDLPIVLPAVDWLRQLSVHGKSLPFFHL